MNFLAALVFTVCLVGGKGNTFLKTADPKPHQEPARKGRNVVLEYLEVIGSFVVPEKNDDLDVLMEIMSSQNALKKPTETPPELSIDHESTDHSTTDSEETNAKPTARKAADSKSKSIKKKTTHKKSASSKPTHGKTTPGKKSELQYKKCVLLLLGLLLLVGAVRFITQTIQRKEKWQ